MTLPPTFRGWYRISWQASSPEHGRRKGTTDLLEEEFTEEGPVLAEQEAQSLPGVAGRGPRRYRSVSSLLDRARVRLGRGRGVPLLLEGLQGLRGVDQTGDGGGKTAPQRKAPTRAGRRGTRRWSMTSGISAAEKLGAEHFAREDGHTGGRGDASDALRGQRTTTPAVRAPPGSAGGTAARAAPALRPHPDDLNASPGMHRSKKQYPEKEVGAGQTMPLGPRRRYSTPRWAAGHTRRRDTPLMH